ncbi:MAG: hypothetical protein IJW37_09855 [Lachnospiraceae bacterium]|nr:hypothetical protein [Lachnospiraceae bacterium]
MSNWQSNRVRTTRREGDMENREQEYADVLNVWWFVFGGWASVLFWFGFGGLFYITYIGRPVAKQLWVIGKYALAPFGKKVDTGGGFTMLGNVIWLFPLGVFLMMLYFMIGGLFAITIIGFPFAKKYCKIASMAFMPFGVEVKKYDPLEEGLGIREEY